MIDNWFTNKCMTLVGDNGRALTGEALAAAEQALSEVKMTDAKVWADNHGVVYYKARGMFTPINALKDKEGRQVRICGKRVSKKAKFCSRCGNSAPGSWWRCAGCGKPIAAESKTCPHCGRDQNPTLRFDISDGSWRKDEEVFAERFELLDILPKMTKGLNIQENHCALLLDGGAVAEFLAPGFYKTSDLDIENVESDKTIVMVDRAEFNLPVCVEGIKTKDDITTELHAVVVLRFDPENAKEFMCNLMGNSLYLASETLTYSIGYDAIAHCLLADIDSAARDFCNNCTVEEIFKDAKLRLTIENSIAERLQRNLSSIGMKFVRLKEVDFSSEIFDQLREKAGEIEQKRREIEFMLRADELANDATRREALSEYEMEDFMQQLAHEKGIKDDLRVQEIERMKVNWERQKEKDTLSHEHDLDDLQQTRQLERDRIDAQYEQEMLDMRSSRELQRRLNEQEALLSATGLEGKIRDIKRSIEIKDTEAKQEATRKWEEIQQNKIAFQQKQKIELLKATAGADIKSLLMIEDDQEKRKQLLALHEQEIQSTMTPELLLAAAAARGNAAAIDAMSRLNRSQLELIERSKNENKEIFEKMLQMNERMFNQATEKMAQSNSNSGTSSVTTQVIK